MTKAKDKKFKNFSGRHTVEEILEKCMRVEKGKWRGHVRAKQRELKRFFYKLNN